MTSKVYTPKGTQSIPILWESDPELGHPIRHNFANHTIHGYIANGKRRASHLMQNQAAISKRLGTPWHFPYAGTITVLQQLPIEDHKGLRSHLGKEMSRLGISASVEMEITTKNLINFHLTIREAPEHLMKNRARKLRDILRKTTTVKLNMQFKPMLTYKDAKTWINYCSKLVFADTKTSDDVDKINDVKDIYKKKRVLFKKMTKGERMQRFGDFGDFWEQTPTASQTQYKAKKQTRKAKNANNPDVAEAAKEWADMSSYTAEDMEKIMHDELEKASPQERQSIDARNKHYAEQRHGGKEDYADYQRQCQEQQAREEHQRELRKLHPRKTKTPKTPYVPFDPANCVSFTTYA